LPGCTILPANVSGKGARIRICAAESWSIQAKSRSIAVVQSVVRSEDAGIVKNSPKFSDRLADPKQQHSKFLEQFA